MSHVGCQQREFDLQVDAGAVPAQQDLKCKRVTIVVDPSQPTVRLAYISGTTQLAVSASSPSPIESGSASGRVPIVPDS